MKFKNPIGNHQPDIPFGRDYSQDPVKKHFYTLFEDKHCGVDYLVPIKTKVYASFGGIVVRKEIHQGMGKVIGIRNGNLVALYAHLSKILVKKGEIVKTGVLIGYSGRSGKTCLEPHLHFEVRDISRKGLKNMVFEPRFGEKVIKYKTKFTYKVNNKNTLKSLRTLSRLFFGTSRYCAIIKKVNHLRQNNHQVLPEGLLLTIPNYTKT